MEIVYGIIIFLLFIAAIQFGMFRLFVEILIAVLSGGKSSGGSSSKSSRGGFGGGSSSGGGASSGF